MTPKTITVECIGSVAEVSLWIIDKPKSFPFVTSGIWGGAVLGNDAIIVARCLLDHNYSVRCQLLDPTEEDVHAASAILGSETVVAIGGTTSRKQTRSLCIENQAAVRSWVFSRCPRPNASLQPIVAEITYVDYYPELSQYFDVELTRAMSTEQAVYFNVSTNVDGVLKLPHKPTVIQVSGSSKMSLDEASVLALRILRESCAMKVVVTLANNGAVLAMEGVSWHHEPKIKMGGSILGAGAVFSSEMIIGLMSGRDREDLLEWAVENTATKLSTIGPECQ